MLEPDITGSYLSAVIFFLNKWMKQGNLSGETAPFIQYGKGICEQRLMDEHIQLWEGDTVEFEHDIVDHNLNNLSWACHKYVNYAIREAIDFAGYRTGFDRIGKSR